MDINKLNCEDQTRNVGFGKCVVDWKIMEGFIMFDTPKSFTAAELQDIVQTIQDLAHSDNKALRAFPITDVFNWTDNSEDVVIQTSDTGKKIVVRDGDYDWTSQHTKGANCLLEAIQSHNGDVHMLYFDKEGKLMGTKRNGLFSTIPVMIHGLSWKTATGSAVAQYLVKHIFNSEYVNGGNVAFVKCNLVDLKGITPLQDLKIVVNSFNDVTGVANIKIMTECGSANVGSVYSTDFASAALFQASNATTGDDIEVLSSTYFPNNGSFDVTINPADGHYPDDGKILLGLAASSVLAAAGVIGYELYQKAELEVVNS